MFHRGSGSSVNRINQTVIFTYFLQSKCGPIFFSFPTRKNRDIEVFLSFIVRCHLLDDVSWHSEKPIFPPPPFWPHSNVPTMWPIYFRIKLPHRSATLNTFSPSKPTIHPENSSPPFNQPSGPAFQNFTCASLLWIGTDGKGKRGEGIRMTFGLLCDIQ